MCPDPAPKALGGKSYPPKRGKAIKECHPMLLNREKFFVNPVSVGGVFSTKYD
jgi:hypothetical protein